jgi:hypothetical protein
MTSAPLADPIAEARRLIELAGNDGLVLRALGGVAICLQAPGARPRLPRRVKDIDLAAAKGASKTTAQLAMSPTRCSTRCAGRDGCCFTIKPTAVT